VDVHRSARKHGIDDDSRSAGDQYVVTYRIDDNEPMEN
jgi:hypothetical protein